MVKETESERDERERERVSPTDPLEHAHLGDPFGVKCSGWKEGERERERPRERERLRERCGSGVGRVGGWAGWVGGWAGVWVSRGPGPKIAFVVQMWGRGKRRKWVE